MQADGDSTAELGAYHVAARQHAPPRAELYVVHVASEGDAVPKAFVELLKRRRKAMKLRQEDLAEAIGVTRYAVIDWEASKTSPSPELVVPLAAALRTEPDQVFRALGWLPLDVDATPLPELPPEMERLVALYAGANDTDAAQLLERLAWVIEWFESRQAARDARSKNGRRAG